ncbi:hypothetical protein [Bradyrhizobium sp. Ai1a-2]|uniref:hypothetical protein n=1 Tax=Bradyrhizobium sp. Ai1a-2 TaxID=196490 RepID=UPI00126949F7|nr:hypothetical protein [Bradyrhizobium sp. Ai1a-2]
MAELAARGLTLYSRQGLRSLPSDLSLLERLSTKGLDGLSEALSWQSEDQEGKEPDGAVLISHALAVAGGRTYATHGPGKLDWIGHFVAAVDNLSWETFADSSGETLARDPVLLDRFTSCLVEIATMASEAPDTVIESSPRGPSAASTIEQFARGGSFQEIWEAERWPMLFRSSDAFEILRRAAPERFLMVIDRLPHPTLVSQCLSSEALLSSQHDVLRLLRTANAAFDAEGHWRCSGMAAILLLRTTTDQLLTPEDEDRQAEHLAEGIARFRNAIREVLDTLFARSDGAELAWHWLENLLRRRLHPPRNDQRDGPKQIINRIGILVHALSSRMAPRRSQDGWISAAPPLERQFRAVAVLSVAAWTTTIAERDVKSIAKGLIKGDGFELTSTKELTQLPGAPLRTVPGDILAALPQPASWFGETWSSLRFERERSWRAETQTSSTPAKIMGIWGLGAIESLVTNPEVPRVNAGEMWLAVERVFREAILVEPRLGRDFWSDAVASLFLWWPQIFTEADKLVDALEAPSPAPAALAGALAPYVGISNDFMVIIVALKQAGCPMLLLDRAVCLCAGQDLLRMIDRFWLTARHLNDARAWNQAWVAILAAIEKEIQGLRENVVASGPGAQR